NVASWGLPDLDVVLPTIAFIHGEMRVPGLVGEHLGDTTRTTLSNTPLTRALRSWVSEQVNQLAQLFSKAQARETRPEDREKAKRTLNGLRKLMRSYLEPDAIPGDEEDDTRGGADGGGGTGRRTRREKSWGSRIDEIVLEPTHPRLAVAAG